MSLEPARFSFATKASMKPLKVSCRGLWVGKSVGYTSPGADQMVLSS